MYAHLAELMSILTTIFTNTHGSGSGKPILFYSQEDNSRNPIKLMKDNLNVISFVIFPSETVISLMSI